MFSCFIHLAGEGEEMNSENITWLFLFCHSHRKEKWHRMSKPGECLKCKDFHNWISQYKPLWEASRMASTIVNRQCHLPNGPGMQRTTGLVNYWWPSRVNLSSLWAKKRKSLRSWFLMDISVMKGWGCFGGNRVHLPTSSLSSLWGQHCDQNYMKYPNT